MSENAKEGNEAINKENNLESPLLEKNEEMNIPLNNNNLQNKNEEKKEEKIEDKEADKTENKTNDKANDISEDKNEEKKEDKIEDKPEDKTENKTNDKNNDIIENKNDEKNEGKTEDVIKDINEDKPKESKENFMSNKAIESLRSLSYIIKRRVRWVIFLIFIIINLLMNFDHGTIPAATEQIKEYLDLSDSELGLFGSLIFIGVLIGSLISLSIINTFNRKYILMVFLIICGVSLFLFTKTKKYILLCIDRVIIGVCQAFISIYLPVWCDQFGIESRKGMMMALIQVAKALGVLVGYVITTLENMLLKYLPIYGDIEEEERWIFSFYIQSFSILGLSFCLLLYSDKYFNSNARRVPLKIEETLNMIEAENSGKQKKLSFFYEENKNILDILKEDINSPNISEKDENEENQDNNKDNEKENNDNLLNDNKAINSTEEIEENNNDKNNDNNIKEKLETNKINEKDNTFEDISFFTKVKLIFSEPLFICCSLTLSIFFFTLTVVQYWGSDYMLVGLGVEDEKKRLYCFAIVCLTSPTLGLVIGGYITDKIGGYATKGSLVFCLGASSLSIIPTIPIPLVNNIYLYSFFLWILLFLGGALLPALSGIIIVYLPKKVQGSASSFVIFFYNLLGYLPAPFLYGFLKEHYNSRVAQKVTMYFSFSATICIGVATFIRFYKDEEYIKKLGKESSKLLEEIKTNDISIKIKDEDKYENKLLEDEKNDNENKDIPEKNVLENNIESKNIQKNDDREIHDKKENNTEVKNSENIDENNKDEPIKVSNDQ